MQGERRSRREAARASAGRTHRTGVAKVMAVRDIMSKTVKVVSPEATLQQAAEQMRELDVGSLLVCDGERLVGMVTDRDIAVRAVARGDDPKQGRVRDVMTG